MSLGYFPSQAPETEAEALQRRANTDAQRLATLQVSSDAAQRRNQEEEDAAEKRRIKEAKKLIEARKAQRTACFGYRQSNENPNEQSLAAKFSRLNDLNPEALVGEFLALSILTFFRALFLTEYAFQQRAFSDALEIDEQKRLRINARTATDDKVRVAYAPLRDLITGAIITDANGFPVFPVCYPVDAGGNIDYHQTPITDGTASRDAQRANGFVPIENLEEACEIQMLRFTKDMTGAGGFTPAQMHKLNLYAEAAKNNTAQSEREFARDGQIANARAAQQQAAAAAAARARPAPGH